ncbi:MAG: hypothetical protein ACFCBW_18485 [Candidatus Competibacterales bacterium]
MECLTIAPPFADNPLWQECSNIARALFQCRRQHHREAGAVEYHLDAALQSLDWRHWRFAPGVENPVWDLQEQTFLQESTLVVHCLSGEAQGALLHCLAHSDKALPSVRRALLALGVTQAVLMAPSGCRRDFALVRQPDESLTFRQTPTATLGELQSLVDGNPGEDLWGDLLGELYLDVQEAEARRRVRDALARPRERAALHRHGFTTLVMEADWFIVTRQHPRQGVGPTAAQGTPRPFHSADAAGSGFGAVDPMPLALDNVDLLILDLEPDGPVGPHRAAGQTTAELVGDGLTGENLVTGDWEADDLALAEAPPVTRARPASAATPTAAVTAALEEAGLRPCPPLVKTIADAVELALARRQRVVVELDTTQATDATGEPAPAYRLLRVFRQLGPLLNHHGVDWRRDDQRRTLYHLTPRPGWSPQQAKAAQFNAVAAAITAALNEVPALRDYARRASTRRLTEAFTALLNDPEHHHYLDLRDIDTNVAGVCLAPRDLLLMLRRIADSLGADAGWAVDMVTSGSYVFTLYNRHRAPRRAPLDPQDIEALLEAIVEQLPFVPGRMSFIDRLTKSLTAVARRHLSEDLLTFGNYLPEEEPRREVIARLAQHLTPEGLRVQRSGERIILTWA